MIIFLRLFRTLSVPVDTAAISIYSDIVTLMINVERLNISENRFLGEQYFDVLQFRHFFLTDAIQQYYSNNHKHFSNKIK